jgi:hypothetical protein
VLSALSAVSSVEVGRPIVDHSPPTIVEIAKNYELLLKNTVDRVEIVYSNIRNAGITGVVIAVRTGTNSKRRVPAQKKGDRYVGNRTRF